MVQQPRGEEPLYSCTVAVEDLTGHQEEEVVAFGHSPEAAQHQAEQLLVNRYGCDAQQIQQLMQQAQIEPLTPWCAPSDSRPAQK